MLKTYDDFISRVNKLGYFPFYGRFVENFPLLDKETLEEQWHTGDMETDPWKWKDRAAIEKRLAFGCILGGYKGFVSKELYPLFYTAYRPTEELEERYRNGEISRITYDLYRLFENGVVLSTSDIRTTFGVSKKSGASKIDTSIQELQREFYITVCGNKRRVSSEGLEYGWPANTYCKVEDWAPKEWLADIQDYDKADAISQILDIGCSMNKNVSRAELSKFLFKTKVV